MNVWTRIKLDEGRMPRRSGQWNAEPLVATTQAQRRAQLRAPDQVDELIETQLVLVQIDAFVSQSRRPHRKSARRSASNLVRSTVDFIRTVAVKTAR
jgi:hypothetical protein